MVLLNITHNIQEWGNNPGYQGDTPRDVKPIVRFLGLLRRFDLIKSYTFLAAVNKSKVAKMVLTKLLSEP